jgi:hypothetical protein
MRRIVIDPGAFLTWFAPNGPGRVMRAEYEAGTLAVRVPSVFALGVLALASSRGLDVDRLERLAGELARIGFETQDPPASALARWLARGLDATRAPYPALAADADLRLASNDEETLRVASALAERPA